jgi:hypothetical protein
MREKRKALKQGEVNLFSPEQYVFEEMEENIWEHQFNVSSHYFNEEIAIKYGIVEAVILQSIAFWIKENKKKSINFHHGLTWTYNSVKEMKEKRHKYLTEDQIRYALEGLVNKGVLIKANLNSWAADRTLWYTIIDPYVRSAFGLPSYALSCFDFPIWEKTKSHLGKSINGDSHSVNSQMDLGKSTNGFGKIHKAIPVNSNKLIDSQILVSIIYLKINNSSSPDYPLPQVIQEPDSGVAIAPPEPFPVLTSSSSTDSKKQKETLFETSETISSLPIKNNKPIFGSALPPARPSLVTSPNKKLVKLTTREALFIPVIEFWNKKASELKEDKINTPGMYGGCPNVSVMKIDNSGFASKSAKSVLQKMVLLDAGTFFQQYKTITRCTQLPALRHNTKQGSFTESKYNIDAILMVLEAYWLNYSPEYMPISKSALATTIHEFFGPGNGGKNQDHNTTSWFYETLHRPAVRNTIGANGLERVKQDFKDEITKIHSICEDLKIQQRKHVAEEVVASLFDEYNRVNRILSPLYIDTGLNNEYVHAFGNFKTYLNGFISFTLSHFDKVWASHFRPERPTYREQFKSAVMTKYGFNILPNNLEVKKLALVRSQILINRGWKNEEDQMYVDGEVSGYFVDEGSMIETGKIIPWWKLASIG